MWIGLRVPLRANERLSDPDTVWIEGEYAVPVDSVVLVRNRTTGTLHIGRAEKHLEGGTDCNSIRVVDWDGVRAECVYLGTFRGQSLVTPSDYATLTNTMYSSNEYQDLLTRAVVLCRAGDEEWANILGTCSECPLRTRCQQRMRQIPPTTSLSQGSMRDTMQGRRRCHGGERCGTDGTLPSS